MRDTSNRAIHELAWWAVAAAAAALLVLRMTSSFADPFFHFDGRYLMAAADCVTAGRSPYAVETFAICWEARTGMPFRSSFVFPPQSLLPSLPLAFFPRPQADHVLLGLHALIFGLFAFWSIRLLQAAALTGARRWTAVGWLGLTLSGSGVFGTIFVGQVSLFVATGLVGLALAATGARQRPWGVGLVLALFKPHLAALPVLAAILIARPVQPWRLMGGAAVLGLATAWIFWLDPGFIAHYREALAVHAASTYANVATPELLYGLPGLFAALTPQAAMLALTVVIGMAVAALLSARHDHVAGAFAPCAYAAAVLIGALLVPHKGYDFAIYAVVFLVAARQSLPVQAILLAPLLVAWRPTLLSLAGITPQLGATVALLGAAAAFATLAWAAWRQPDALKPQSSG